MASTIKVNNIQNQCGANIANKCGSTITLGASGDTITLACGASQTGFGRTGTVDWQTGSIKTANFTAVNGEGYFCDTSGGAFTATLPASPSAGDIVAFSDYTRTFNTNGLLIGRNSEPIGGISGDATLNTEGQTATFVYVDSTEGWINIQETSNSVTGSANLVATGGTITTSGDYKIHTFTGPGTFAVNQISCTPANNEVSYVVVAGGGGGGGGDGGGGGAGGFRESKGPADCYTSSPLEGGTAVIVTAQSYPITVGAGGAGAPSNTTNASNGANSVFSTITSTGGGRGGSEPPSAPETAGNPGGSGGGSGNGGNRVESGGSGNTPSVSPPQGNNGGNSVDAGPSQPNRAGGGGGGASGNGNTPNGSGSAGSGGNGVNTSIVGSSNGYAGGGGGGGRGSGGSGGTGGGGSGSNPGCGAGVPGGNGNVNTGSGGGGFGEAAPATGGTGGSGIVIIRYKYQ